MQRNTATPFILATLALFLTTSPADAQLGTAIQSGADRVVELQHTDGLWGWPLNETPTHTNTTGPIGLGLLKAHAYTGSTDHVSSAKAAGDALDGLNADWVGTYNPMFLVELHNTTGISSYQNQAQSFYDELTAGTYTRNSLDYDTSEFVALVQNGRSGSYVNMRPWEFAPLAYAADAVGSTAQRNAFVGAIKDGIDTLDNSDSGSVYYDVIGLAGGVMGLSWLGEDHDPTTGSFSAAESVSDLADVLASLQNSNGSWNWHSNLASPISDDEDRQSTAIAMLALLSANESGQYDDEILLGRDYFLDTQLANGGWLDSPAGGEHTETNSEIVWALSATSAIPEPASLMLVGLGSVALLRRRRA